jgi:hypothetical protein
MLQHAQNHFHLIGDSVIGEIARDHQRIGEIVDDRKLPDIVFVIFSFEVDVRYCG